MPRYTFAPRLDSLDLRIAPSAMAAVPAPSGPPPPAMIADDIPTDPVDAPPWLPLQPIIIAPVPPPDPGAPVLV